MTGVDVYVAKLASVPPLYWPPILLVVVGAYASVLGIYRLYLHPLSSFPGPKLAAVTRWHETYYEIFKDGGAMFTKQIKKMHEQYGPIVRINPDELHIDDPEFYEAIYSPHSNTDKLEIFEARFNIPKAAFSTADHAVHKHRRAAITPFFTKTRMQQHGPFVQSLVDKICQRLSREFAAQPSPINFNDVFSCLSGDVIMVLAFDKDYDLCSSKDWQTPFTKGMTALVASTHITTQFPFMVPVMNMIPDSIMMKNEQMGPVIDFRHQMDHRIRELLNERSNPDNEKGAGTKHTVFEALLTSKLPPQELTEERLQHEAVSIIGAAFDTTRQTLAKTCYRIIKTQGVYEKLHAELVESMPDPSEILPWEKLQRLPYLTACVEEGLRLGFGTVQRSPRVNRFKPLYYADYEIPPGTPVSSDSYHIHSNSNIFPDPYQYIPDRWLNNPVHTLPDGTVKQLSRYNVAFGRGSRMCLGMQMAYSELYMMIASLMRRFRFELYETTDADVAFYRDYITPHPREESKGIRALVFNNQ